MYKWPIKMATIKKKDKLELLHIAGGDKKMAQDTVGNILAALQQQSYHMTQEFWLSTHEN